MDREQVRAHWRDWASKFGTALGATTRTGTAKMLEIDALVRRMSAIGLRDAPAHVLEVGCGNGRTSPEGDVRNVGLLATSWFR